jgi:hypothetical protein
MRSGLRATYERLPRQRIKGRAIFSLPVHRLGDLEADYAIRYPNTVFDGRRVSDAVCALKLHGGIDPLTHRLQRNPLNNVYARKVALARAITMPSKQLRSTGTYRASIQLPLTGSPFPGRSVRPITGSTTRLNGRPVLALNCWLGAGPFLPPSQPLPS